MYMRRIFAVLAAVCLGLAASLAYAQQGQTPGINDQYKARDLNVTEWVERFEGESREVYALRHKIVAALGLKPGQHVGDVGAGTGLFIPLLVAEVGEAGKVYGVDITPAFVRHIEQQARQAGLSQVTAVLSGERSIEMPAGSLDVIFISDAYHHFVYYQDMLASMHKALRPGGQLIVTDFDIESKGLEPWIVEHVGHKKEAFRRQIEAGGFSFANDLTLKEMKTNFMYRFIRK
jgi:ubiquinone/menaquinone biosynthesis C-methylase UbiE